MIQIPVKIKLPFLWGKAVFRKNDWTQVNLIVGPNGSGKTLLAEALREQFEQGGYEVEFFKADRKQDDSYISILKDNEAVRSRVEFVLSNMFGKSIVFIDDIDGRIIPVVKNKAWNVQYDLNQVECHGLKEIITLLVALYSQKNKSCLILDEPELHLHPQLQSFFIKEVKKCAKQNPDRVFFLITHSPFFIDLRFPEDLLGVIVCHINREPTHIDSLSKNDAMLFRRFLPRFNTYHKQFFFSDNQIFVEGYTDQQMFTYLLPYIHNSYSSVGTGIIDVGGKDELGVFCKVCSLLGTDGRIITDLDSLFSGKLRDVFCNDERVMQWLERQEERQQDFYKTIFTQKELAQKITLEKLILKLEKYLIMTGRYICNYRGSVPRKLRVFFEKLNTIESKYNGAENIDTYKTVVLQGIMREGDELKKIMPKNLAENLGIIKNLFYITVAGAEAARVYILPKGCIEHYYTQSQIDYMPVSAKDKLFHTELEHLLHTSRKKIQKEYSGLIELLEKACVRGN